MVPSLLFCFCCGVSGVVMAVGGKWGYSADTQFPAPRLISDNIDIDDLPKPHVYDENFKRLPEVNLRIFGSPALEGLRSLHSDVLWMLFVDWKYIKGGPATFDSGTCAGTNEEPGYFKAAMKTYKETFSLANMRKRLDADYYVDIHRKMVHDVKGVSKYENYRGCDVGACFRLVLSEKNHSPAGRNEFKEKQSSIWISDTIVSKGYFWLGNEYMEAGTFIAPDVDSVRQLKQYVNVIFSEYYSKLEEIDANGFATGSKLPQDFSIEDKKLEVIVRICQNLEQLHAFEDGNMRTVYLLLQRMLVENGLSPTVLYNPNVIDLKSVKEIIGAIKAGQERFTYLTSLSEALFEKSIPSNSNKSLEDVNKTFKGADSGAIFRKFIRLGNKVTDPKNIVLSEDESCEYD